MAINFPRRFNRARYRDARPLAAGAFLFRTAQAHAQSITLSVPISSQTYVDNFAVSYSISEPTIPPLTETRDLEGTIRDNQGAPVANVPVYLYQLTNTASSVIRPNTAQRAETGVLSTVTDADGRYVLHQVPGGFYRVIPDHDGYRFEPSEIQVQSNVPPIVIEAIPADLHDTDCRRIDYVERILNADALTRELYLYADASLSNYEEKAMRLASRGDRSLLKSLRQVASEIDASLTRILRLSQALPKVGLACPRSKGCRHESFASTVRKYRARLAQLRRQTLFVFRRARDTLGSHAAGDPERLRRAVVKRYGKANRASGRLPVEDDRC